MFLIEFRRKSGNTDLDLKFRKRFADHLKAYFLVIFLMVLCYLFIPIHWYHKGSVIAILTGISVVDFATNYLLADVIKKHKFSIVASKSILVAGTGNTAKKVAAQLALQGSDFQIMGFINCSKSEECMVGDDRVLGDLENINQYLFDNTIDEIVIALPPLYNKEIQSVLSIADYHGVRAKYILDYHEIFGSNYKITRYGHIDALDVRKLPVDGVLATSVKACFDKVFAFFVLLFLLPVFLIIAILIKLDSPGPVFYYPVRIGRGGKSFKVFKFRSMRENDNTSGGTLSTQMNDPRITKLGRILRKYSLDELPQFINVILGDMSVVGPRPHRRFLNRQLQDTVYKYMVRHYVKPGITGWAQVNGWRGPTETEEQRKQRTLHDLWYLENWSFWLDLKIIYLTIFSGKANDTAF